MKRWRAQNSSLPKNPKTLTQVIEQIDSIVLNERFSLEGENFIHKIPSSSSNSGVTVALFCHSMLRKIIDSQSRITGFIDGTFGISSALFSQLYVVHLNVKKYVSF